MKLPPSVWVGGGGSVRMCVCVCVCVCVGGGDGRGAMFYQSLVRDAP